MNKRIGGKRSMSGEYVGEFDGKGKRSGNGVIVYKDGRKYDGQWLDGKRHGHGVLTYPVNDTRYEGSWVNDVKQGKGKMTFKIDDESSSYDGDWVDNKMHGKGTMLWFIDGKQENSYEGDWADSNMQGKGVFIKTDGVQYMGRFVEDELEGAGTVMIPNVGVCKGIFHEDEMIDDWTCVYDNGDRYIGEMKNANRNGRGTMTYADGTIDRGRWLGDTLVRDSRIRSAVRQTERQIERRAERRNSQNAMRAQSMRRRPVSSKIITGQGGARRTRRKNQKK